MDRKASADSSWKKNGTLMPLYLRPDGGGIIIVCCLGCLLFVVCVLFYFTLGTFIIRLVVCGTVVIETL